VRSHGSWKSGSLALDLLEFACLHEADFTTFRSISVAIHLSQLLKSNALVSRVHETSGKTLDPSIIGLHVSNSSIENTIVLSVRLQIGCVVNRVRFVDEILNERINAFIYYKTLTIHLDNIVT